MIVQVQGYGWGQAWCSVLSILPHAEMVSAGCGASVLALAQDEGSPIVEESRRTAQSLPGRCALSKL